MAGADHRQLSDLAGVAMIAIVLTAVLARPAPAFGVTLVAFALLKTWPPAAVWAAPVLGGVTRTDPTDLVAVVVLIPLWRAVRRAPNRHARASRRVPVRVALVTAAVFATTATGSEDDDLTTWRAGSIAATESDVFAWVNTGEVVGSSDGGLTWRRIHTRSLPRSSEFVGVSTEVCRDDVCWSVGNDRLLRAEQGSPPVAVPLPDGAEGSTAFSKLVTVTVDERTSALFWLEPNGIVRIGHDEQITWHPIEELRRTAGIDWATVVSIAVMFAGPIAILVSSPAARRSAVRRGLRPSGVHGLVLSTGLGSLLFAAFGLAVAAPLIGWPALPTVAVMNGLIALWVVPWSWSARRRPGPSVDAPVAVRSIGSRGFPPPDGGARLG